MSKFHFHISLLLLIILVISCTSSSPLLATNEIADLNETEEEVVTKVVDELFPPEQSNTDQQTVFLQVFDKNPSLDLIQKLNRNRIKFKPASSGIFRNGVVKDSDANTSAKLLTIDNFNFSSPDTLQTKVFLLNSKSEIEGFSIILNKSWNSWQVQEVLPVFFAE